MAEKVIVPTKYLDYVDIFSEKLTANLPKQTDINKHAINLEPGKQPLYGLIYSWKSVKLKTLKMYIETNLVNNFI